MLNLWSEIHLAQRLGIPIEVLNFYAEDISAHCTSFQEKSKSGKLRNITAPSESLKKIQKRILKRLLYPLHLHPSAHGGVPQKSSKTNANAHKGAKSVYQLDLASCFPNVHSTRVRRLFEQQLACRADLAKILTKLTTFNNHLPQGFPTSPTILNLLCIPLDNKIFSYVNPKKLTYTRYIDDIAVSGEYITEKCRTRIKDIVTAEGFILNEDKEHFSKGEKVFFITGINASGNTLKVQRAFKRKIRAVKNRITALSPQQAFELVKLKNSKLGMETYTQYVEEV